MSEVRYVEHPQANINGLINSVNAMTSHVDSLSSEVVHVNSQVNEVQRSFEEFLQEFRRFVEKDLKDRRLAEALSDRVILQDELAAKFTRHQTVRKYVTGILQAADVSLVKKETMAECTEELMVAVPHYWLVPALIALVAWLNDDKDLAERALREAIARDDEKTSLLFALICRRASRNHAANTWLHRYFSMQDPLNIERKLIVVLDAYANGLFGGDSRGLCAQQLGAWIAELEETVGFREKQIERWKTAIEGKIPGNSHSQYQYLSKYAKNWEAIRNTLNNSMLHAEMHTYLRSVFEHPAEDLKDLKKELDDLLNSLVSNFDANELPLREQLRFADLVIEAKGDEGEAARRFSAEKSSFDEHSDLTQLLTNAAMNPELVHASHATQKLSMSISRDWMIAAYDDVTLKMRDRAVSEIEFEIEGFNGTTVDGSNEDALCVELEKHFTAVRDGRLAAVKQSPMDFFLLGAGVLVFLLGIFGVFPWFIGLIGAGLGALKFFMGKKKVEQDIQAIKDHFTKVIADGKAIVKALCAETIDFRREVAAHEQDYEPLMNYMKDIAPERFVKNNGQRNIGIA